MAFHWAQVLLLLVGPASSEYLSPGSIEVGNANDRDCDDRGCYPKTGNLLIGREGKLSATSTHQNRSIENVVNRNAENSTQYSTWWQSEEGVENVTIQLDLESEFFITGLFATFKTQLPAAMSIEHSPDNGTTWKALQYFADDCGLRFPGVPFAPNNGMAPTCISKDSWKQAQNGSIIYRIPPPPRRAAGLNDSFHELSLFRSKSLRINLNKLQNESRSFSMYEMAIFGRCWCNGHAERCLPENPGKSF